MSESATDPSGFTDIDVPMREDLDENDWVYYMRDPRNEHAYAWAKLSTWSIDHRDISGVQLEFGAPAPERYYLRAPTRDLVESRHEVKSIGRRRSRLVDASPTEALDTARMMALKTFAYWWYLEQSDYPLGYRTPIGRRKPRIESLSIAGTLTDEDGNEWDTPYTLADIVLINEADWKPPRERAIEAFEGTIDQLLDEYPDYVVDSALKMVGEQSVVEKTPRTEERKRQDEFDQLRRSVDGVGRKTMQDVEREFNSVSELEADIRAGANRTLSIDGIGERTIERFVDSLSSEVEA